MNYINLISNLRLDQHLSRIPREKWIFFWLGLYHNNSYDMEDNFRRTFNSVSCSQGSSWAWNLTTESGTTGPRWLKYKRYWGHSSSSHALLGFQNSPTFSNTNQSFDVRLLSFRALFWSSKKKTLYLFVVPMDKTAEMNFCRSQSFSLKKCFTNSPLNTVKDCFFFSQNN